MNIILVLGARRSGTTLLNQILCNAKDSNPHIGEAQIITRFCGNFRWSKNNYDRVVQWYFSDEEECLDFYRTTINDLIGRTAKKYNVCDNIVLKNPEFSKFKPELDELLPAAKQVVCIRDPRDQVVSELDVGKRQLDKGMDGNAAKAFKTRDIEFLAKKFNDYYLNIDKGRNDNLLYIRYEDLINELDKTLSRIESFTGLNLSDYDPDKPWVRFMHKDQIKQMPAYVEQYGSAMDKSRVARYKDALSEAEQSLVLDVCHDIYSRFYQ